jgi:DNA-binding transcriptional LysR family regulator
MDVRQVRYFLQAARTLNFTRAAELCHVSQPALTMAIKRLEEELGSTLFRRSGRGLSLTQFGKSMRPALEEFANQFDRVHALAHTQLNLNSAPLRLGVLSTIGPLRISDFLAQVERELPDLEVTVEEDSLDRLWTRLTEGSIDVCIANNLESGPARLRSCSLYNERYVVVLPPGHPLETKRTIELADLEGHAYVDRLFCELRNAMAKTLEQRRLTLYARFRSAREDWVQSMVLAGVGFAVMPEHSVTHADLVIRPLVRPELRREVALFCVEGAESHPAVGRFVEFAGLFRWQSQTGRAA